MESTGAMRMGAVILLAMAASGCQAVTTIFEAGIWVGVIMVVLIVGIVGFIASRFRRP